MKAAQSGLVEWQHSHLAEKFNRLMERGVRAKNLFVVVGLANQPIPTAQHFLGRNDSYGKFVSVELLNALPYPRMSTQPQRERVRIEYPDQRFLFPASLASRRIDLTSLKNESKSGFSRQMPA
jgi:hypothetical protein